MSLILTSPGAHGQLASALDGIRLSIHVLAATIWVGGQFTLAGLVPTARQISGDAPKMLANAFARLMWPAYAVLLITGVWNISATQKGQSTAWKAVLVVKVFVVLLSGLAALLHSRSSTKKGLAIWGSISGLSATAALVLGVFLAG
jgi:putative copper export protein